MTKLIDRITAVSESLQTINAEIDNIASMKQSEFDGLLEALRKLREDYESIKGKLAIRKEDLFHSLACCVKATAGSPVISSYTLDLVGLHYRIRDDRGKLKNASELQIKTFEYFCLSMIEAIDRYIDQASSNDFNQQNKVLQDLYEKVKLLVDQKVES